MIQYKRYNGLQHIQGLPLFGKGPCTNRYNRTALYTLSNECLVTKDLY